jgi:hypothetical protein
MTAKDSFQVRPLLIAGGQRPRLQDKHRGSAAGRTLTGTGQDAELPLALRISGPS